LPAPVVCENGDGKVPSLKRVAMLWSVDSLNMPWRYEQSLAKANELGISVRLLGVREPDDFDGAFALIEREIPDGLLMAADTLNNLNRRWMYAFARAYKLPTIYETAVCVHEGGLMSYGPRYSRSPCELGNARSASAIPPRSQSQHRSIDKLDYPVKPNRAS
jgi:ABC-type uncharacterized transport system substrate-binding protein